MQGKIIITNGDDEGRTVNLPKNKILIGRSQRCLIPLKDSKVSGNHCEINFKDDHFCIKDLGSTNGTFVNNVRINQQDLKHQDIIQVGKTSFRFELVADEPKKQIAAEMTEVLSEESEHEANAQVIASYRIVEKLEEDQTATFYKVEHLVLKNILILKVIRCSHNLLPDQQKKLQHNIDAIKKLHHTGIVALYDVFWREENLVLVSDYIPGKNLIQILQSKASISWRKILRIIFYAAVAMDHIHSKGIYHGGLNLSNIIIEEGTKDIKLDNVALVPILEKYHLAHPAWIEENRWFQPHPNFAKDFSPVACDLYSLACIFLFLLWGKRPERLQTAEEWLQQLNYPELPSSMISVLRKTLVEHSFGSAKEWYQQLAQIAKETQNT